MSIAWVMFFKSVILAAWAVYAEDRKKRKRKDFVDRRWKERQEAALLARFQAEWDRRRAKQPLALTDRRSDLASGGGAAEDQGI